MLNIIRQIVGCQPPITLRANFPSGSSNEMVAQVPTEPNIQNGPTLFSFCVNNTLVRFKVYRPSNMRALAEFFTAVAEEVEARGYTD